MHTMLGSLILGTFPSTLRLPGQACKHGQSRNMEKISIDVIALLLDLDPKVTYMPYHN